MKVLQTLAPRLFSRCDVVNIHGKGNEESTKSNPTKINFMEDEVKEIKTPPHFHDLKSFMKTASVDTFDGFRLNVHKPLRSKRAEVSHFYSMGSTKEGQAQCKYGLKLPLSDKYSIEASADLTNVTTDVVYNHSNDITSVCQLKISDQESNVSVELDKKDQSSNMMAKYSTENGHSVEFSLMQAITPGLILGGFANLNLGNTSLSHGLGGVLEHGDNVLAMQYDTGMHVLYKRIVNPNRLHLTTELVVDDKMVSHMTASYEAILRDSKVHFSVDSDLTWRSRIDVKLPSKATTMELSAEMNQINDHYLYGIGIVMG